MQKCPSHICVLIPTYNNAGTLHDVLRRTYAVADNIIVVNDGSTDNTQSLLDNSPVPVSIVSYPKNKGKGYALKQGFLKARELGFTHALTLDSDGQHLPEQIPQMAELSLLHPKALIVGSRTLEGKEIDGGSMFANKFSNFWFTVQTGLSLPDTQSGMRIYPLDELHGLACLTSRYEAELELLVWAAWANVKIIPCPIEVYYPPQTERISHFRPALDFTRISILNTILCLLAIIYGLPRRFWRTAYYGTMILLVVIPFTIISLLMGALKHFGADIRNRYHVMFMRVCRLLLWLLPVGSRMKKPEPLAETSPAVYIANHNSLLDTLAMLSLQPKIVILSRTWVRNNPLFGIILRTADFPTADDGVDLLLQKMQPLVSTGYSLLVFPEGSRSRDGRLGAFHAGAFYMAKKLRLGIRPFLLRGFYEAMSHNEFRIGPSTMTLTAMPEITAEEVSAANYRQLTLKTREKYLESILTPEN